MGYKIVIARDLRNSSEYNYLASALPNYKPGIIPWLLSSSLGYKYYINSCVHVDCETMITKQLSVLLNCATYWD